MEPPCARLYKGSLDVVRTPEITLPKPLERERERKEGAPGPVRVGSSSLSSPKKLRLELMQSSV